MKVRLGKLPAAVRLTERLPDAVAAELQVALHRAGTRPSRRAVAGRAPRPVRWIFAAQALLEDMALVTSDPAFPGFGVKVLW